MRYISADEVGLVKITTILSPDPADSRPKKKRREEKPEKDEPVKPTTETRTIGTIDRNAEIQQVCWGDNNDTILVARKSGLVHYMNLADGSVVREDVVFEPTLDEKGKPILNKHRKSEHFVGIADVDGTLIACTDLGNLHIIPPPSDTNASPTKFTVAQDLLFKARFHPQHRHLLATGGDERDLCLWDLQSFLKAPNATNTETAQEDDSTPAKLDPIWKARNVKNDFLDLRVPVWITDILFLDSSQTRLLVGTGYHQLRIYDTAKAKRPIINIEIGTHPIRAMAACMVEDASETVVKAVVSDTTGQMMQVDMDVKGSSAKVVGKYAGLAGAVTSIAIPSGGDVVVAVGLDRFLRTYQLKGERKLQKKVYLKQRLTGVLLDETDVAKETGEKARADMDGEEGSVNGDAMEDEVDEDDVWAVMEEVGEEQAKSNGRKSTKSSKSASEPEGKVKKSKRKKTA